MLFIDNDKFYINEKRKDKLILKAGTVLKHRKCFNYNVEPYRTPGYDRLTSF